jgi:hypothetical protein
MLMSTSFLKPIISRNIKSVICDGFVIPNILVYANVKAFTATNFKKRMTIMTIIDYSFGFSLTNTTEV